MQSTQLIVATRAPCVVAFRIQPVAERTRNQGGVVHGKYAPEHQQRDAVGIRLVNGPNKGRYGWVTSDDVHLVEGR